MSRYLSSSKHYNNTLNNNQTLNTLTGGGKQDLYNSINNTSQNFSPSKKVIQKEQHIRYSPYNLAKQMEHGSPQEGEYLTIIQDMSSKVGNLTNEVNTLANISNSLMKQNNRLKDKIIDHVGPYSKLQQYRSPDQVLALEDENKELLSILKQYKVKSFEYKKYIKQSQQSVFVDKMEKLQITKQQQEEKIKSLEDNKKQVITVREKYAELERILHQKAMQIENRNTYLLGLRRQRQLQQRSEIQPDNNNY